MSTQRIVTNLWFDTQAEEAAAYYCSIFADARVLAVVPYPEGTDKAGTTMVVEFELLGQRLLAINGGPQFTFSEAISLEVECSDQAEIDYYWEKLTEDGSRGSVRLVQGPLRAFVADHAARHDRVLHGRPRGRG